MSPIGVIGGSGLYEFLTGAEPRAVDTPYGPHSPGLTQGVIAGRDVVFVPRHGRGHTLPPHRVNYRANLWALRRLGVEQVLAPCAVGSLQPSIPPGSFVVPDQLVDRTTGRFQSFVERGAVHVSFADPYCVDGRATLLSVGRAAGIDLVDGATMVVVEGPRFSTRAESQSYAEQGWSLINMTGLPEAALARELAMCYTAVGLVTDHDAGIAPAEAVTQAGAFAVFKANVDRLRGLLELAIQALPAERTCSCPQALDGLEPSYLPGDPNVTT